MKTVIPTGEIVKKFCEINEICCLKKKECAVTIIMVDDKETHICKPCLDTMIRDKKWYIEGARVW